MSTARDTVILFDVEVPRGPRNPAYRDLYSLTLRRILSSPSDRPYVLVNESAGGRVGEFRSKAHAREFFELSLGARIIEKIECAYDLLDEWRQGRRPKRDTLAFVNGTFCQEAAACLCMADNEGLYSVARVYERAMELACTPATEEKP